QDLEGFSQWPDLLAAEDGADGVHRRSRQLGEVGQRPVLDFAALAIGLTDQDGAVLAAALAAGYDGYVHGTGRTLRHIQIVAYWAPGVNASNGYLGTQAQTRIAFKSFRNFRLVEVWYFDVPKSAGPCQLGSAVARGRRLMRYHQVSTRSVPRLAST